MHVAEILLEIVDAGKRAHDLLLFRKMFLAQVHIVHDIVHLPASHAHWLSHLHSRLHLHRNHCRHTHKHHLLYRMLWKGRVCNFCILIRMLFVSL